MQARQKDVHELGVRHGDRDRHLCQRESERVQPLNLLGQGTESRLFLRSKIYVEAAITSVVCVCVSRN